MKTSRLVVALVRVEVSMSQMCGQTKSTEAFRVGVYDVDKQCVCPVQQQLRIVVFKTRVDGIQSYTDSTLTVTVTRTYITYQYYTPLDTNSIKVVNSDMLL